MESIHLNAQIAPAEEAYEHARVLVEDIGPRGSTTDSERKATIYFREVLRKLGLEVNTQDFSSPRSAWQPIGLCVLLSIFGLLLSWLGSFFVFIGLVFSLVAVYWVLREVNLDDSFFNKILSTGKSQNAWAKIPPKGEKRAIVVLLAHLDSHRTPLIMQSRFFSTLFSIFSMLGYTSLVTVPFYLGARLFLIENNLVIVIFLTVILGTLGFLILQADFTKFSPGANDNASSVGLALTCARHFVKNPFSHTEIWILGTGCEEVGCYGIRRFLDYNRKEIQNARFIDLELIGRGAPAVVLQEGLLFKQKCDLSLLKLAQETCLNLGHSLEEDLSPVYGETYIINKQGLAGITLNAKPGGKPDAYWHTPRDTMDKLDLPNLELMFLWTGALIQAIDQTVQ